MTRPAWQLNPCIHQYSNQRQWREKRRKRMTILMAMIMMFQYSFHAEVLLLVLLLLLLLLLLLHLFLSDKGKRLDHLEESGKHNLTAIFGFQNFFDGFC